MKVFIWQQVNQCEWGVSTWENNNRRKNRATSEKLNRAVVGCVAKMQFDRTTAQETSTVAPNE